MNLELYVKHILNWHDGEVRLLGDPSWAKFPATGGDQVGSDGLTVFHPRFWHYQYMRSKEAREYMHWRKTSKYKLDDLRTEDVKWVLAREGIPDPKGSTAAGEDRHLRDVWSHFFATSELLDM